MIKQIIHYSSFIKTVVWTTLTFIGYLFLSWDIGETLLFINLGFLSFFLNYYFLFLGLSFREYMVLSWFTNKDKSYFNRGVYTFMQAFHFISNLFLLTCMLALVSLISVIIISTYFKKVEKIESFDLSEIHLTPSFFVLVGIGCIFILFGFIQFYKTFQQCRTNNQVFDWDAFKPFFPNNKRKLYAYYFGSVFAIALDGLTSEDRNFGVISFVWLFILTIYWAYVDVRHPINPPIVDSDTRLADN